MFILKSKHNAVIQSIIQSIIESVQSIYSNTMMDNKSKINAIYQIMLSHGIRIPPKYLSNVLKDYPDLALQELYEAAIINLRNLIK